MVSQGGHIVSQILGPMPWSCAIEAWTTLGLHGGSVDDLGVICVFWVANDNVMAVFDLVAACGSFPWPLVATVVARAPSAASTSRGSYKDGMDNFGGCLCGRVACGGQISGRWWRQASSLTCMV